MPVDRPDRERMSALLAERAAILGRRAQTAGRREAIEAELFRLGWDGLETTDPEPLETAVPEKRRPGRPRKVVE